MQLMDKETEEAVRLLTQLADGDVRLVRAALKSTKGKTVEEVIRYIESHRRPAPPRAA
jgi:hypothetical protein